MSQNTPSGGNSLLDLLTRAVASGPDRPALLYFDGRISYAELDRQSDALAAHFQALGLKQGDRLMLCLQNVPDFIVGMLATLKAGGVAVPINPMYRDGELTLLLEDSEPHILICHDSFAADVVPSVRAARPEIVPDHIFTVSPRDRQTRDIPWVRDADGGVAAAEDAIPLRDVIASAAGGKPRPVDTVADDLAMLVYTSGTSGKPKGAMISHGNMLAAARFYHNDAIPRDGAPVLGLAPLFHVTGLSGHIFLALAAASPLILSYRFEAQVMIDSIREHQAVFAVGAITALAALAAHPAMTREAIASVEVVMSGGAPIPPAVHESFRERTGLSIRNVYGLTETSGPVTAVPAGKDAPVDPVSGALSVGRVTQGVEILILDEDGQPLPDLEPGELVTRGECVVNSYWRKPKETAAAMTAAGFRTGDIAVRDADGWYYIVDRKKDMIIASGYKVWPREVEDVLYAHPAVREAAVVGVADSYRGETVMAAVSLREGLRAEPDEIIAYCKQRLAAYKYPRIVAIMDDLPKTPTGKIIRAAIRDAHGSTNA